LRRYDCCPIADCPREQVSRQPVSQREQEETA
jgi:hypothetical protein